MHIVITGGMGCGKSTITNYLKSRLQNYHFCDVDERVRSLYDDPVMQASLVSMFGTHNRRVISDMVFSDPLARQKLYSLMNAIIFKQINSQHIYENVLYDIPLYFEHEDFAVIEPDVVIAVVCDQKIQYDRIRKRDGFTDDKIASILQLQLPLDVKCQVADHCIITDGTQDETICQLEKILADLGV